MLLKIEFNKMEVAYRLIRDIKGYHYCVWSSSNSSIQKKYDGFRKLLPQLCVCVSRLVTMVRILFTRSLGRLTSWISCFATTRWSVVTLDPGKRQMNILLLVDTTILPTRARNNDTLDRRRIVNNMR